MELTKEEAIRLHRELWGWLAENPGRDKREWPEWEDNGGKFPRVRNLCFACEYDHQEGIKNHSYACSDCPFEWPGKTCENMEDNGLYNLWKYGETELESMYAAMIRDLPIRGE